MRAAFEEYSTAYEHVRMRREGGVLELMLHSEGRSLVWGPGPHTELGYCFADVAADPENRVVILTGAGHDFINDVDTQWATPQTPAKWDKIYAHGRRLLMNLLNIDVPIIAALNGPVSVHAEIPVLSDICIAAEDTFFADFAHFQYGVVPGDGAHIVWMNLIGPNRGRYFLMTNQKIAAEEALRLGVVSEVLPKAQVRDRAWDLARELAAKPDKTLRYLRLATTAPLKKLLTDHLDFGLALEGLAGYEHWPTI